MAVWLTDLLAVVLLGGLALWSFVPSFGAIAFFVGMFALFIGAGWALLCDWRRWPWWVEVSGGLLLFIVLGPALVAPQDAASGFLPTVGSVWALFRAVFTGWSDALVSQTPIGRLDALLVLPFASGLAIGLVSTWLTRSRRLWSLAAPLVPLAVLVGGLVVTTDHSIGGVEGALLALVSIAWMSSRQRRFRAGTTIAVRDRIRLRRLIGLVAVAVLVGWALGSFGPVSGSNSRTIVRDHTIPPVDVRLTTSPLSEYRVLKVTDKDTALFTLRGAVSGLPIRVGTMDYWDGGTWQSAPVVSDPKEAYERVSGSLPVDSHADQTRLVTVTLATGWAEQVWIPTVGDVSSVSFGGPGSSQLLDGLRYDVANGSLAEPQGLTGNSSISEVTDGPEPTVDPTSIGVTAPADLAAALGKLETKAACGGKSVADLDCMAAFMHKNGALSDGALNQPMSLAGSTAQRLTSLASELAGQSSQSATGGDVPAGDGEQFAALLALVAAQQGYPVHVVVGVRRAVPGVVRGRDLTAWAEVYQGGKWIMLADPVPTTKQSPVTLPQSQQVDPVPIDAPSGEVPPLSNHLSHSSCTKSSGGGACDSRHQSGFNLGLPAWIGPVVGIPLALLALFAAVTFALIGAKSMRRNRRRSTGDSAARVSSGWKELTDVIRDAGWILPVNATRRESAVLLGRNGVSRMARRTDGILFGPDGISEEAADAYWSDVDATSASLLASLGTVDRWKARVNLTSFGVGDWLEARSRQALEWGRLGVVATRRWIGRITQ